MFKHLLVPIDGSDLTDRAMTASLEFARQFGASVTGFVAEPHASSLLERFAGLAKEAGVPFTGHHAQVPRVDKAIVAAAESQGCDMIVMVTHGRGALG